LRKHGKDPDGCAYEEDQYRPEVFRNPKALPAYIHQKRRHIGDGGDCDPSEVHAEGKPYKKLLAETEHCRLCLKIDVDETKKENQHEKKRYEDFFIMPG